ncbi:MAG: flagellin FliC3 [Lachnospiraceae bacterium]|nr:flagellin FliC3 [Lachnospiraceae bacterium]
MRISFNASAVIANNSLSRADNRLSESLARLSSGLKIVGAKDNPAGLAMSKRMNAQLEGVGVATQNANDGISIIEVADGTLSEIQEMLQRANELCVKASNGVMTEADRKIVNEEVIQLKEEIERIAGETEFNGQAILDGSFDLRGYTKNAITDVNDPNHASNVKVAYYSDEIVAGTYTIDALNITYDANGNVDLAEAERTFKAGANFPPDAKVTHTDGGTITITGSNNFELKLQVTSKDVSSLAGLEIELQDFGAMDMQIGANEGQQLAIRIPKISLENIGISALDTTTESSASEGIDKVDAGIKFISSVRSRLGAYQNRLEHTVSSLDITTENMTAAYSRIMDVDMAEEMTEYTTLQVLSQASTSMLAQANERPSQVLQLLQ